MSVYPFETEHETIFESARDGGYEAFLGNFVRSIGYCSPVNVGPSFYFRPRLMKTYANCPIEYSMDGIYYMPFSTGYQDAGEMIHAMLNGEDCLCVTIDNKSYRTYKISDLQKCWKEYTENAVYVYLNGKRLAFDVHPIIKDDTTLIPIRFLFETAGAAVEWNDDEGNVSISYGDKNITVSPGSDIAYVNGAARTMTNTAELIDGKMMIPLRSISEELGFSVDWDPGSGSVFVNSSPDNITTFVSLPGKTEYKAGGVKLNGDDIQTINVDGRTFIGLKYLNKYFKQNAAHKKVNSYGEFTILSEPDTTADSSVYFYRLCNNNDFLRNPLLFNEEYPAYFNNIPIPVYSTHSYLGWITYEGSLSDGGYAGEICVEEAADRLDCMHYEWIAEDNTLYVYISDNMVKYDDALKAILDKRSIAYSEKYTGDFYKDINAMQKYSDNDLSVLVQAGIQQGIINKDDYPDGHLRPTRTISHLDFYKLLRGVGYSYQFDNKEKNTPVTKEEFNDIINRL